MHYPNPPADIIWPPIMRLITADGTVIPTPMERAEQAEQRVERFAQRLREQGVDPDAL